MMGKWMLKEKGNEHKEIEREKTCTKNNMHTTQQKKKNKNKQRKK